MITYIQYFLAGTIYTAAALAGMTICMVIAVTLMVLLPEKIHKKIEQWRARHDKDQED